MNYTSSDKAFRDTVVNRALSPSYGGSLKITLTVPLSLIHFKNLTYRTYRENIENTTFLFKTTINRIHNLFIILIAMFIIFVTISNLMLGSFSRTLPLNHFVGFQLKELYDLEKDPGETENLANSHSDILR